MAISSSEIQNFINLVAPLVQKYAIKNGYKVASPIIAQACLESAYGTSGLAKYHNYFGLKCGSSWTGPSVNMSTKEEYNSQIVSIKDNFRVFSSLEEGIKGYFDFISRSRYANLKSAINARQYLEFIKADGYATISNYVDRNMRVVQAYNLTRFDNFPNIIAPKKTDEEIAKEVLRGIWGNGNERKQRLAQAGYDYDTIQNLVQKLKNPTPVKKEDTKANTIYEPIAKQKTDDSLKEGDIIKLDQNATYYNGKKIPIWVKKTTLYYRGTNIQGIKFSTKKSGSITGVVDKKYVSKVN